MNKQDVPVLFVIEVEYCGHLGWGNNCSVIFIITRYALWILSCILKYYNYYIIHIIALRMIKLWGFLDIWWIFHISHLIWSINVIIWCSCKLDEFSHNTHLCLVLLPCYHCDIIWIYQSLVLPIDTTPKIMVQIMFQLNENIFLKIMTDEYRPMIADPQYILNKVQI